MIRFLDLNIDIMFLYLGLSSLCILLIILDSTKAIEVGFKISLGIFIATVILFLNFKLSMWGYYFMTVIDVPGVVNGGPGYVEKEPLFIFFGIDSLNMIFLLLTTFIFPFCYYYLFLKINNTEAEFFSRDIFAIAMLLLELGLLLTFTCMHLLAFYFFFESLLIPMYFIIFLWGAKDVRKFKAANYFFLYTSFFSSFMLYSCFYISAKLGFLSLFTNDRLQYESGFLSFMAWLGLILAFGVKIPIFPLHIWLPEAHVEAPVIGSVLLASLLLKVGGYGLMRFVIPCFKYQSIQFAPILLISCSCSVVYAALLACRQVDIKKIIAYSSIVHMNFALIGIFSWTVEGVVGGLTMFLSHGFVSGALFFLIGILYDRLGTRLLNDVSGLVEIMPLYSFFLFIFILANLGFPLSFNFVGEFLIFLSFYSSYHLSILTVFFCCFGFLLNLIYCIWTFNRVCFGQINWALYVKGGFYDLAIKELMILIGLLLPTIIFGIRPNILIEYLDFHAYFAIW